MSQSGFILLRYSFLFSARCFADLNLKLTAIAQHSVYLVFVLLHGCFGQLDNILRMTN